MVSFREEKQLVFAGTWWERHARPPIKGIQKVNVLPETHAALLRLLWIVPTVIVLPTRVLLFETVSLC